MVVVRLYLKNSKESVLVYIFLKDIYQSETIKKH